MKANYKLSAILFLVLFIILGAMATSKYLVSYEVEPIYWGPGVKSEGRLSDLVPTLEGTSGDARVYYLDSGVPGPTVIILGGVHGPELSGILTAVIFIENAIPKQGKVIVIPQANASSLTYTPPGEAWPRYVDIETKTGIIRRFRVGDRLTNPRDQWPDPDVYSHYPSGMQLAGSEVRNLNRSFPGRENGLYTEKIAYAITQLAIIEDATLLVDLHEAPPQYTAVNVLIRHERASNLVAGTAMDLKALDNIKINPEPSPVKLRGLTHREIGDATDAYVALAETANVILWPLRGKTNAELLMEGKDEFVMTGAKARRLFVPYDETGLPIELRVGRHVMTIIRLIENLYYEEEGWVMEIEGMPTYEEILEHDIGYWLLDS